MPRTLSTLTTAAYSVGHVHNDLCASMWFTYLLLFFTEVIGFSGVKASNLLLIGQLVDGIATPLVGIISDKGNGFFCYSKRKSWHLLGTVFTAISFPFIFHKAVFDVGGVDSAGLFAYYIPFICLFQIGWAIIQINHFAIIPELTPREKEKNTLGEGVDLDSKKNFLALEIGYPEKNGRKPPSFLQSPLGSVSSS